MSNGYRGIGIAALIASLLITLFLGAYFGSLYAPQTQYYQSETAYGGKANPATKTKNGLADITGMDGYTERIIAKPQPKDRTERENRDLAAQENSAVFAYWVFWAVVLQTFLAGGALVALAKDLRQNRQTAKEQLRAYIHISALQLTFPEQGNPLIYIEFKNAGQTPATNVRSWVHTWVEDFPLDSELPKPPPDFRQSSSVMLPNLTTSYDQRHGGIILGFLRQHISADMMALYAYGCVEYDDVFGEHHVSEFLHCCKGDQWETRGRFSPYMTGNTMS